MKCATCFNESHHIVSYMGAESCHICGGFSEASGAKTDGILTRHSTRVHDQQSRHEGDFVQPHSYNKHTHRSEPNPDFVKMYPDKAKDFYSDTEMLQGGYKELPKHADKQRAKAEKAMAKAKDVTFTGDAKKAAKKYLV